MRRTITTTLLLTAALPLLLTACNEVSPYNEACTALCEELVVDCELPGYQDSSCVPNCEAALGVVGEPDALLDCYEGAGCSVVDLIECRRLEEADRL